jgi:hypothetical protein
MAKPERSKRFDKALGDGSAMISSALSTNLRPWYRSAWAERRGKVGRLGGGELVNNVGRKTEGENKAEYASCDPLSRDRC